MRRAAWVWVALLAASTAWGTSLPGAIEGTVTKAADGLALADQVVRLEQGGVVISSTTTGADGAFLFTGLSAGSYTVRVEPVPAGQYLTPAAREVVLAAGETKAADFALLAVGAGGHIWDRRPGIQAESVGFRKDGDIVAYARCGETVSVSPEGAPGDSDLCLNFDPGHNCAFGPQGFIEEPGGAQVGYAGIATNNTVASNWDDGGADGEFVADAQGRVVGYRAGKTPQVVTITCTLDDEPGVFDPVLQAVVPTADDPPIQLEGKLTVWDFRLTRVGDQAQPPTYEGSYIAQATIAPATDHAGQSLARRIQFDLTSSAEPGLCLNRTTGTGGVATDLIRSTTAEDLDLKFYVQTPFDLEEYDGGPLVSDPVPDNDHNPVNYNRATSTEPQTACTLGVLCLDYGAYGTLTARIPDLPPAGVAALNGAEARFIQSPANLTVEQLLSATPTMRLPKDDDANLIADGWEHNAGGTADDAEAQPVGAGVAGDGLTRYEEYRGWYWGEAHLRTDPQDAKDLFVARAVLGELPPEAAPYVPPDAADIAQLGYALHVGGGGGDVEWSQRGGLHPVAVLSSYRGTASGRNSWALALVAVCRLLFVDLDGDGKGERPRAGATQGTYDTGATCYVDIGNVLDAGMGTGAMQVVAAHEIGHALYILPPSGQGHAHIPPRQCIMDNLSAQASHVFCSTAAIDPACHVSATTTGQHSLLEPTP